jgi:glutamyl-Q tRNA(Asp) synthetase
MAERFVTRFAPSPTGPLHLGHAYSALLAHDMARAAGGRFLLRIEDTDRSRARPEWEQLILEDLAWLGLTWEHPLLRQSDHLPRYDALLSDLATRGLVFPCSCTRADIRAALSAPQEGVPNTEGPYPGTCRNRNMASRTDADALRLNMAAALAVPDLLNTLGFDEGGPAHRGFHRLCAGQLSGEIGDAVLGRKDISTVSYVLATVADDAAQGITDVIRGEDLFAITPLQVLLQGLLGLPTPRYFHHHLIRDDAGKRLAKRDDARALAKYRAEGATPADIRRMVGLGMPPSQA